MKNAENYLKDLGYLIREMADDARRIHAAEDTDFSAGYLSGLRRVVSVMQQQAEDFNIPLSDIKLNGIEPDRDVV